MIIVVALNALLRRSALCRRAEIALPAMDTRAAYRRRRAREKQDAVGECRDHEHGDDGTDADERRDHQTVALLHEALLIDEDGHHRDAVARRDALLILQALKHRRGLGVKPAEHLGRGTVAGGEHGDHEDRTRRRRVAGDRHLGPRILLEHRPQHIRRSEGAHDDVRGLPQSPDVEVGVAILRNARFPGKQHLRGGALVLLPTVIHVPTTATAARISPGTTMYHRRLSPLRISASFMSRPVWMCA